MQMPSWFWPAILVASALAINVLVLADIQTPLRPMLALWFLLVCPGMALVRLLRIRNFALELSLAVALSIALDALAAGSLLYARRWSPEASLIILGIISCAGAVAQLRWPPEIGVETGDTYDNNGIQRH